LFEHKYDYELEDVLKADRFVEKEGYWEGYRKETLAGYVLLSTQWTSNLVGYSGKHMETLVGMDTLGVITGVKLLFHSEPIVLIGLKEKNYQTFLTQYTGKDIRQEFSLGKGVSMDAVTGATVTAVIQNAIILRSARKAAVKAGLIKAYSGKKRKIKKDRRVLSWSELLKTGGMKNLKVTSRDLEHGDSDIYLDVYFGVATVPSVGSNVLGTKLYDEVVKGLEEGEAAILILSRGEGSFKGSGFARGGIFDRFNITQGDNTYVFRDRDYRIITDIKAGNAPEIREGGLFIVRDKGFDPTSPYSFNLVLPFREGGKKEFRSFAAEGGIPDEYLE
jgi:NosR/NirI family nitrous oxide reductase transcriptional regulator